MDINEKARWRLALGYKYFFGEPRNIPAAAREFGRVTDLAPDWSEGYALLSCALEEMGQVDGAIATCREAMRRAPDDFRHPLALGRIFLGKNQYAKSIKMLRKGISLKPRYGVADAHNLLAEALFGAGEADEAYKVWRFVLTLKPTYPSYEAPLQAARHRLSNQDI